MLEAGITVHKALDMYAKGDESKFGRVIDQVSDKVLAGSTLSVGLSYFPRIFSPVYLGVVRAGEQSGRLHTMLEQLAILLERQDNLRRKLTSSLTYPIFLLGACVMCCCAFMFYILPAMGPLYDTLGVPLPAPTRFLVWLGQMLRDPYTWAAVAVFGLFLMFYALPAWQNLLSRRPDVRERYHRFWLDLPLLGIVLRKMIYARVLFTLATLLEVGIPAATSLMMVRDVSSNQTIKDGLAVSCSRLEAGSGLGECLDNVLPTGAVQMITVGEEASNVVRSAQFVARVFEEDADMAVTYFAALSEPLIMAGMGVIAAFLVLALILPIVSLLQRM